jgi:fluoride ion exporter CrcB/FEX
MVDSVQLWGSSPLLAAGYIALTQAGGIALAALGLHLGRKRAGA